jgi:thioredoxin-dependent peroxiredoxin
MTTSLRLMPPVNPAETPPPSGIGGSHAAQKPRTRDGAILWAMSETNLPSVGTEAPDFELADQDGNAVRLSDLRGRKVVLYFYPKADTPGCTTQACGIRDRSGEYEQAGATVLGVSPDPVKAVKKFHDKQSLNFTLLADTDHAVAERYGVWVEKSMYGKTYWGAQRATFVLDEDGVVRHVIPKASPKTHDDEVLAALADLQPA